MNKQVIPINMIDQRRNLRMEGVKESGISFNPTSAVASVNNGLKQGNYKRIKDFLNECTKGYLAPRMYWINCYDAIIKMENWCGKESEVLEAQQIFVEEILPKVEYLDEVMNHIDKSSKYFESFNKDIIHKCQELQECDRVLNNNQKLSARFNFNQIIKEADEIQGTEDTIETLCELVDTYDIPIANKMNITIENILYSYSKAGIDINREDAIRIITEYFLRYNDVIPDGQYSKMCNVLENNRFISTEDINKVYYLFTEQKSFHTKIEGIAAKENESYKNMIEQLDNCKTLAAAKVLIKKAFELIFTTFIVTAIVSFGTVTVLLASIFALILKFVAAPLEVIATIDKENKRIDTSKLTNEEKERGTQVNKQVNDMLTEVKSNNPIKEAANMIDSISNNAFINNSDPLKKKLSEMNNYINITLESKDFADSDDVKEIIKRYKADQNKNVGRLKMALSHIYTKKPEKIIDDTPNILEFIRNFGILSTLAINPVLTLVVFCTDKYIELGLKRKEAERALKYFKAEKIKIEKKMNKLKDGDKRDRLEEYSECLDQSIKKLEDHRDSLYSDSELDKIRDLEEASNINRFDRISVDEYFDNMHSYVYDNLSRANQLFYNEFFKKYAARYFELESYELFDCESIITTFKRIDPETLISNLITPDGMINIPIIRIKYLDPDNFDPNLLFLDLCTSCDYINEFLPSDCKVINTIINDNIFITFNYLKCLYVEDDDMDYAITYEARTQMASILALAEAIDDIEKLYPIDTTKDLFKNIDKIVTGDDTELIAYIAASSKCVDMDQFIEGLKDLRHSTMDPILSTDIMAALENITKIPKNNGTLIESSLMQAEAIKILHAITEEVKAGNKKPIHMIKNSISLDEIKDSIPKGSGKKVSLTTNVGLASQMLKKNAQNLSTKEKEISRNTDITLSQFRKSIEKALTTDRRESIIKGSIIPSFSKIIKSGMIAGGLYLVNPVVAAIGVIGALAMSKALTDRERQMLLDEIDIELKAVEREISNAESNNKMKEYRQLLTYQRKLQREKQRIKYRLKMTGRDNIPDVGKDDN